MASHTRWYAAMIFITFIALVVAIIFHFAGSSPVREALNIPGDWYMSDANEMNEKYLLKISPDPWTHYVWIAVYFTQVVWLVYAMSMVFRTTADGRSYIYNQGSVPPWLFVVYLMMIACNLGYTFSYDRDVQIVATVMRFMITLTLVICQGLLYAYLYRHGGDLIQMGQQMEVYMIRALMHNGISLYLGWNTFLAAMNMGANFYYLHGLSMKDSCTIGLCVVAFQLVIYTPLDLFTLDRHMRYTFAPYIVMAVGMAGVIIRNWEVWERNTILASIILAIIVIAFAFKIGFAVLRHRRWPEPLLYSKYYKKKKTSSRIAVMPGQYGAQPYPDTSYTPPPAYPWLQPQPYYGAVYTTVPRTPSIYGLAPQQTTPTPTAVVSDLSSQVISRTLPSGTQEIIIYQ